TRLGAPFASHGLPSPTQHLAVAADRIVVGLANGSLHSIDPHAGSGTQVMPPGRHITAIAASEAGVALGFGDGTVGWLPAGPAALSTWKVHEQRVADLAVTASKCIVSSSFDRSVVSTSCADGKERGRVRFGTTPVSLALMPDGGSAYVVCV